MPATALKHFQQDAARARAIVAHAGPLPQFTEVERLHRSDLLRSAWMFAVAALDAYYCDAYTDLIAVTVSSKSRQPTMELPSWFYDIEFPIRAILEEYDNENWRWRMAARKMMERKNVIRLSTIQELFNKFFRNDRRLFRDKLDSWMSRPDAKKRLFGVLPAVYLAMNDPDKKLARKAALNQFEERFRTIFQRRHDCIHNCDRPKSSPTTLDRSSTVLKVIQDVEFLVSLSDEHINLEFRHFLVEAKCSGTTTSQAGY